MFRYLKVKFYLTSYRTTYETLLLISNYTKLNMTVFVIYKKIFYYKTKKWAG